MTKQTLTRTLAMFSLPAALLAGCDSEEADRGVVYERATLTQLGLDSDALLLLHPVKVHVAADLDSEAFATDLVIGLRGQEHEGGCVLGAMKIEHLEDGEGSFIGESEFIVNASCAALVDAGAVELFAAFDPWDRLGDHGTDADSGARGGGLELYGTVSSAAMDTAACESCEDSLTLAPSPGLDAQLREVRVSSSVAVLPVGEALPEGRVPGRPNALTGGLRTPDFSVSSTVRVTGLDKGRGLEDGQLALRHRLRPLGDQGPGLPLVEVEVEVGVEGGTLSADHAVSVSGPQNIDSALGLYMEGEARAAVVDGPWATVEDFELVTCAAADFEQAVYAGELAPRDNDCAAIPVVVLRDDGSDDAEPLAGAAAVRQAESWGNDWGWNNNTFGYSGVDFDAWLDINASEGAAQTYGGTQVNGTASWFEAGVLSTATVFDIPINIINLYATFIAYEGGTGGAAAMGATLFFSDFVPPFEVSFAEGQAVTLDDMFTYAGLDIDPSISLDYVIAGVDFDDGCGNVTAAMKASGTLGIDTAETSVTVDSTPTGAKVTGVFTPYLNLAAIAETSVSYGEYLSGGIAVTLNLLNIDVPFTVTAEYLRGNDGTNSLIFTELAQAALTVLSGDITYYIRYKIPWPLCWANCTKTHDGTLLDWNGYSPAPLNLFSATQTVSWSAGPSTCGNDVCEWDEGSSCASDCGPSFMYADRVDVEEDWVQVYYPHAFTNPVVIVGPASHAGSDPVVVRVRNVDSEGFEVKLQEYDYDDGDHSIEEVAWMVLEKGTHTAPDGTTWEVGTASADELETTVSFSGSYSSAPLVLASAQTYSGTDPISVRVDDLSASSFNVWTEEEEAKVEAGEGHNSETVGYVAIDGTPADWNSAAYSVNYSKSNSVDENWDTFFGTFELKVQEEQSEDSEVGHSSETLHVLHLVHDGSSEELVFAQDVTNAGTDSCALRWR